MAAIPVQCPHCHDAFDADGALAGGITNCPRCGKAVEVEGLRDPLWRLFQVAVVAVAIGAGLVAGRHDGLLGAGVAVAVLAAWWLLRRAL